MLVPIPLTLSGVGDFLSGQRGTWNPAPLDYGLLVQRADRHSVQLPGLSHIIFFNFLGSFSCASSVDGLYPHPSDCSKFIQCHGGQESQISCPSGLLFNPKIKACDWPANVQCAWSICLNSIPNSYSVEKHVDLPEWIKTNELSNKCPMSFLVGCYIFPPHHQSVGRLNQFLSHYR